jgi:hypothetical protein
VRTAIKALLGDRIDVLVGMDDMLCEGVAAGRGDHGAHHGDLLVGVERRAFAERSERDDAAAPGVELPADVTAQEVVVDAIVGQERRRDGG